MASPAAAPATQGALIAAAAGAQPPLPEEKVVYLTFDDGPFAPWTAQILDVLAEYGAHATFFLVGRQAAAEPEIIQRMFEEGHGVANHTWSHASLRGMSWQSFKGEIESTANALGDSRTQCIRPPYGHSDANTANYALRLGYALAYWNVDPQDWRMPGAKVIADRVFAAVHPQAVVLLHDGGGDRSQTVAALRLILERLKAEGYSFKAVCREATVPVIRGAPVPDDAPDTFPFPTPEAPVGETIADADKATAQEVALAPAPATQGALVAPDPGTTVSGVRAIVGYANSPTFEKWQMDLIAADGQEIFLALSEEPLPSSSLLMTWDTSLYPNGLYTLRLRVVDEAANYEEYLVPVAVQN